jgi:hypothetical protein
MQQFTVGKCAAQILLTATVPSSLSIYCPEQNSKIGRPVLLLERLISSVHNHHSAFLKGGRFHFGL